MNNNLSRYCINCGIKMIDNNDFCVHCGFSNDISKLKSDRFAYSNVNNLMENIKTDEIAKKRPLSSIILAIIFVCNAIFILPYIFLIFLLKMM